jgi:hypothetical protein
MGVPRGRIPVLIFSLVFLWIFSAGVLAYEPWDGSDWKKYKDITIKENSGSDLLNYAVFMNISHEESMRPDFGDLRFAWLNSSDGIWYKLPYWIETAEDSDYAETWVRIPIIPANNETMIRMHYGNPAAENEGNGDETFEFFDDFSGNSLDTSKWYTTGTATERYVVSDGVLKCWTGLDTFITFNSIKKFKPTDYITTKSKFHINNTNFNDEWININHFFNMSDNNEKHVVFYWSGQAQTVFKTIEEINGEWFLETTYIQIDTNWHESQIILSSNPKEANLLVDGSLKANHTNYITDWYVQVGHTCGQRTTESPSISLETDWTLVAKYVSPEPTYMFSGEAEITPPPFSDHSVIISTPDWMNVITAAPVRVPVLVADGLTPEVLDFVGRYNPEYVYTLGFDAGLNNSFKLTRGGLNDLFFPNATSAIYVNDRERGVFASALAYYLGVPMVFADDPHYDIIDLSGSTPDEIRDMYLSELNEDGVNVDYLVLTNPDSDESLLAGRLACMRNGYIVFPENLSFGGIIAPVRNAAARLAGDGMFSGSLGYKKGDSLYLAILGGNGSIPFIEFFDPGFEIFNNADNYTLYTDIWYGDLNGDGTIDAAPGRLDGELTGVSLQMASGFLAKNKNAVLVGEYRHEKYVDTIFSYGGMFQAFLNEKLLEAHGINVTRIVEKRVDDFDMSAYGITKSMYTSLAWMILSKCYFAYNIYDKLNTISTAFYFLFEFNVDEWLAGHSGMVPKHLPVIDGDLAQKIGNPQILGYFGMGESYWWIPLQNRSEWDLFLRPYENSTDMTELNFSGFMYSDHDVSIGSEITRQVLARGGSVLASSGVVHDPYTLYSSGFFLDGVASGKTLGQSIADTVNFNLLEYSLTKFGNSPYDRREDNLYWKDKYERMLFSDPKSKPVEAVYSSRLDEYSVRPERSFMIESEIKADHRTESGLLMIGNADSYLMRQGRPIIPVFVREFILPKGAGIISVGFDGVWSKQNHVERPYVSNDSHYRNYTAVVVACAQRLRISVGQSLNERQEQNLRKCIMSTEADDALPYPEKTYWYTTHEMLDGRVVVDVIVPGFMHKSRVVTDVLERGKISLHYESPYEMELGAKDALVHENATIEVEFYNGNVPVGGTLWLWIEGGDQNVNISENLTIPVNGTRRAFNFVPETGGLYKVTAVFDCDKPVGPRVRYFNAGVFDFSADKTFFPDKLFISKLKKLPKMPNKPKITIENTGEYPIRHVRVVDQIPAGFKIYEVGKWAPIFVYVKTAVKKSMIFIDRKYYSYRIGGDTLTVDIPNLSSSNLGRYMEKGDVLVVEYVMTMDSKPHTQETITKVYAAPEGGVDLEKTIKRELAVV